MPVATIPTEAALHDDVHEIGGVEEARRAGRRRRARHRPRMTSGGAPRPAASRRARRLARAQRGAQDASSVEARASAREREARARQSRRATRPRRITRTRSQNPSSSRSRTSHQDGRRRRRRGRAISRSSCCFAPTSIPRAGSSRRNTAGRASSHFPRTTFCWLPPAEAASGAQGVRRREPHGLAGLREPARGAAGAAGRAREGQGHEREVVGDRRVEQEPVLPTASVTQRHVPARSVARRRPRPCCPATQHPAPPQRVEAEEAAQARSGPGRAGRRPSTSPACRAKRDARRRPLTRPRLERRPRRGGACPARVTRSPSSPPSA